ncbi:hypothetical protein LTR85_000410 [Meristemomyces frigidus]|nr:hypothetical protein LTR85_000410 [Meristemomyces frigidus]
MSGGANIATSMPAGGSSISVGSMTGTGPPLSAATPPMSSGSSTPPISNSGGMSHTSTGSPSASTAPVCPAYNGQNYTDAQGASYAIACGQAYTGTVIPPGSSNSTKQKRQTNGATTASVQSCMAMCDALTSCVAVSLGCTGECTMYSGAVTEVAGSTCETAARKVSMPPAVSVVTVSVCATQQRWGTTTVFTTATMTTCPLSSGMCTAGAAAHAANGRLGEGMIGYEGE